MKFREFETASHKKILTGKDAQSNEELVKKFTGKKNIIFHTEARGSPFCVVNNLKISKKDIKEAAIVCASKSQDWRDNKKDIIVHYFSGENVYKKKGMKLGTFGLKKFKKIKVKKKAIIKFKE